MARDVVSNSVLTNHHINTAVYEPYAIDLARDFVKGHTEDYYFFRYDDDEYVLVFSDRMHTENGFDCSAFDCTAIVLHRIDTNITEHDSVTVSGTIAEVGAPPKVDDVSLVGDISHSSIDSEWKVYYILGGDMHVYNTEYLVYGSCLSYMPKLVEGVSYYAFAAFALAFGIIGFRLIDKFFRRIY